MPGPGAGFGAQLRSERERRGVSLEAMCAETKVNARHFRALEEGDFAALPGGVFRKGIARAYLRAAGLEEQSWMQQFQTIYAEQTGQAEPMGQPALSDEEAWARFAENVKRGRGPERRRDTARWLGVVMLLLAVLTAAWAVWHSVLRMRLRG